MIFSHLRLAPPISVGPLTFSLRHCRRLGMMRVTAASVSDRKVHTCLPSSRKSKRKRSKWMVTYNSVCEYKTFYRGQWIANIRKTGLWWKKKIIFLFLSKFIYCWYSKELSQWECSLEPPKLVLRQIYTQELKQGVYVSWITGKRLYFFTVSFADLNFPSCANKLSTKLMPFFSNVHRKVSSLLIVYICFPISFLFDNRLHFVVLLCFHHLNAKPLCFLCRTVEG